MFGEPAVERVCVRRLLRFLLQHSQRRQPLEGHAGVVDASESHTSRAFGAAAAHDSCALIRLACRAAVLSRPCIRGRASAAWSARVVRHCCAPLCMRDRASAVAEFEAVLIAVRGDRL